MQITQSFYKLLGFIVWNMLGAQDVCAQVAHPSMIEMISQVNEYSPEFAVKKGQIQFRYRYDQSISVCDSKTGAVQKTFLYSENVDFQQSPRGFIVVRKPLGPVVDNGIFAPRVNPFGFVYAHNSNYSFELRTTDVTGEFHIVDTKLFSTDNDRVKSRKAEDLMSTVNPIRHYHLYDEKGRAQFADPKDNRILSETRNGPIATFDFESNYFKTTPIRSVGKYDINCHYAMVSSEQNVAVAPGVNRVYGSKCEYKNIDGFAVPAKFSINTFFEGMGGEGRFVEMSESKTFEKFEFSDSVNESEFSFSKFNFPEPVGVVWKKQTPRYVWWLIAIACCGTIAGACRAILYRLKRGGVSQAP